MSLSQIFNVIKMSSDAFRENEILANISEFTVSAVNKSHVNYAVNSCTCVHRDLSSFTICHTC